MRFVKLCISISLILIALSLLGQTTPPVISVGDSLYVQTSKLDSLSFTADSLKTDYEKQIINLFSNAEIQYHDYTINSDSIIVDLENRKAFTKGLTNMKDDNEIMIGYDAFYDVKSGQGLLFNSRGKFDDGFYFGDEFRRINKKTYDIDNGYFTTCDDLHPHFYIKSKELRIHVNDKIMGKPLILYVNEFPLLWLPYGSFPAKKGRKAGFLVPQPGYSNSEGKYLKNLAYYVPYKDYADYLLAFDLTELKGWKARFNNSYKKRYLYNGGVDFTYAHRVKEINAAIDDWSLQANHFQDFGNKTTLRVNLNYVTSKQIWESEDDVDKRLSEKITSSLSFNKPLLSSTLRVSANYTDNFVTEEKSITLPNISYSLPSKPIYEFFTPKDTKVNQNAWWTKFNFSSTFTAIHTGTIKEKDPEFMDIIWDNSKDSSDVFVNEHHAGVKFAETVYYTDKYFNWLTFTQSLNYNEYWFDRSVVEDKVGRAGDYSATSKVSTVIYGYQKFNGSFFKAMRHILKPSASFTFRPDLSEDAGDYYTFGSISPYIGSKSRRVALSLGQEWQIKYFNKKTEKEEVVNNLLSMNSNCSYDLEKDEKEFSDISHSLNFRPKSGKLFNANVSYNNSVRFSQDPYEMSWLDWKTENWNFSQTLTLSGDTKSYNYFQNPTNPLASNQVELPDDEIPMTIEALEELTSTESWKVIFSHDMNASKKFFDPRTNNLRFDTSFNLTNKWNIAYNNYYNLEDERMVSQSIFLTRDLHCWRLTLKYTRSNEYWDYRLIFFNVNFPTDLKLETKGEKRYD